MTSDDDPAALRTPALLIDQGTLRSNIETMAAARPGVSLRPHVKAFKSTALATRLAAAGHPGFCCATIAEVEGMVRAGLGQDLLLANEVLDATRLGALADRARITVAVDSAETIAAAAAGGVGEVLIDVNVGLPRCGCPPDDAGRLADRARAAGLEVRGVMGYEGHLMMADPEQAVDQVAESMAILASAHAQVGGDVVSAGGTGTYHLNRVATEIQAGSYLLMDTQYGSRTDLPFGLALSVLTTVIAVNAADGYLVADAGLKALSMDHGNPTVADPSGAELTVWFCSDEHTTIGFAAGPPVRVGDRIRLWPTHVDPTMAKHERAYVVEDGRIVDVYEIDLRHW